MKEDLQHLQLLGIFHYILGIIVALFSCFPFIHLTMGIVFVILAHQPPSGAEEPPPAIIGWLFIIIASVIILIGWTIAFLIIMAGRNYNRKKHYTYCLVIACVECLFMPLGTALGIFSIVVLIRDTVKQIFEQGGQLPVDSPK